MNRKNTSRGFTYIEVATILLTLAILSAVLLPSANTYLQQARVTRATNDVKQIADAIINFTNDTAELYFLQDGNGAATSDPPSHVDANRVELLFSDGDIPDLGSGVPTETAWLSTLNGAEFDALSNHLISNSPASNPANRYRVPTDLPGGFNVDQGWRGAYVSNGSVDADPWGNRYAVNVLFLMPNPTLASSGFLNAGSVADYPRFDVFVLSAGADEQVDTLFAQDGAVGGDDDVIGLVHSNAN